MAAQAKSPVNRQAAAASGAKGGDDAFPIVGIGASAGGLRATEAFFDAMPADSGMAFVLVQHLDPDHPSKLAELLQNHTKMRVGQIAGETAVLSDHVYVIPPNKALTIRGGVLSLSELDQPRGRPAVIDQFFGSLADDQGDNAIGIVLSGSGTEGARGLAAIKERGGITLAQDEAEAEYSSMPQNAIASGCVDLVLPVAEMPAKLLEVKGHAADFKLREAEEPLEEGEVDTLERIFALVRGKTGHDFSEYKRSTMLRRIDRRLKLRGFDSFADYLGHLRENPTEVETLFREFLIGVTGFFRDEQATRALERKVIPNLFADRGADETVRVWVPGCATGEEAYSLAILLAEATSRLERPPRAQIFATDIDEAALATAREGRYPAAIAKEVSVARLERFFVEDEGGFRVSKGLREMVLFTRHNLLQDPPFAKLDLISCRNLLIYLTEEMQARVFGFFHFALKAGGHLYLGSSESLAGGVGKFSEVDRKARLFRRREGTADRMSFPTPIPGDVGARRAAASTGAGRGIGEFAQRFLLGRFAPPCVIVDEGWTVVYVSGRLGWYLEHVSGNPTQDILELAREGLGLELRLALAQAARSNTTAVRHGRVATNGGWQKVRLTVESIPDSGGLLLVAFDDASEYGPAHGQADVPTERPAEDALGNGESAPGRESSAAAIEELETELKNTKAALQATIEDLETSNEELRAFNEELQSLNEELQSTGEELQTSQEELQSTNEELTTVNQELRGRVEELAEANSVLDNLGASTNIATVFLDSELRLRRYTPRATDIFHLIPGDIGRPFEDVAHRFDRRHLLADAQAVNQRELPVEREIRGEGGDWFLVRTLPYRTVEKAIDGAVITLVDITARKQVEEALRETDARLRFTLNATGVGALDLSLDTHAGSGSPEHDRIFGYETPLPEWSVEAFLDHVHPDDREAVERSFECTFAGHEPLDFECRIVRADGEHRSIHTRGHIYDDASATPKHLLGIVEDVTERSEAKRVVREFSLDLERQVLRRTAQLEASNDELETFSYSVSHDLRSPLRGIDGFSQVLMEEHKATLGDGGMDYLKRIRAGAQRMGELIDDLLNLSRLAHSEMRGDEVNLSAVAESVLGKLSERQPDRLATVDVTKGLTAYGDEGLLEIALENLLGNAWKFTARQKDARIEFGFDAADDVRAFFVRDNGVGFDMRHAGRLFGPFQRLHPADTFDGTGIGLATVRRILHRHGGKVWAESEVGKGATFFFTLPLVGGQGDQRGQG